MSRNARTLLPTRAWFAAAVTVALLVPAHASATTASIQGNVIVVQDPDGVSETIAITSGAGSNEQGPSIFIDGAIPGPGCTQGAGRAICPDGRGSDRTGTQRSMQVNLAGGDDRLNLSPNLNTGLAAPDVTVDTGAGRDRVDASGAGQFTITTGTEDDVVTVNDLSTGIEPATINLGSGNDRVELLGHRFVSDIVNGETGTADHVSYAGRLESVTVISDPAQPSGRADENDRLSGFEKLQGGNAADTILGGPGPDTLIGGPGANDVLRGFAGADVLDTNDGVADARADCGFNPRFPPGNDIAIIDLRDPNPNFDTNVNPPQPINGGFGNCESVQQQPVGQRPVALLSAVRAVRRGVLVRVRCPRRAGCRGTLRVNDGRLRRVSRTRRFRLTVGQARSYRISLSVPSVPKRAQVVAHGRDSSGRPLTSSAQVPRTRS